MKHLSYFLAIAAILFISACKKANLEDKTSLKENASLTGKWRLVENLLDPGDGSGTWMPVTASTELTFNADGTTYGTAFPAYVNYAIKDSVTLTFHQGDTTTQNYRYKISHDTLMMSPDGPIRCYEACGIKFKKED
ncbi:MAG TPA: hypothetical protein VK668_19535 [Mucilaginibacter sp.]|nr:hypothetical protein [Mucilaginibacter sp.]